MPTFRTNLVVVAAFAAALLAARQGLVRTEKAEPTPPRRASALEAALAAAAFGQVVPSNFILRSEEELASLRGLFADEQAWGELESLAERLALFRIVTASEVLEPGGDCRRSNGTKPLEGPGDSGAQGTIRYRHTFDFSRPGSVSSRVFRAEYARCLGEDGQAEVTVLSARFRSDTARRAAPLLCGRIPMRILKAALDDPGVSRELVERFRERGVGLCQVEYEGPGPVPGLSIYRFVAGDSDPPEDVRLVYGVEYDEAEGKARFSLRS